MLISWFLLVPARLPGFVSPLFFSFFSQKKIVGGEQEFAEWQITFLEKWMLLFGVYAGVICM